MKKIKWLLLLVVLPLFVACFEDKSTPADKPLSNITIEQGIDSVYNIYKYIKNLIFVVFFYISGSLTV